MKKIDQKIKNQIESVLLVAEKPVSIKELSGVLGVMIPKINQTLLDLMNEYKNRGLKIIKKGEYYSMVTSPENAEIVSRYLNEELRHDLSDAAIETLSVVTYKQPVTRLEIEEVRGANSDQIIRNLMLRGLIGEMGRKETPGRPILYGTTMEFLQYFGFEGEHQIPKFENPENVKAVLFEEEIIETSED